MASSARGAFFITDLWAEMNYIRVHVQLSQRERPYVRALQVLNSLTILGNAIYRFGYVNSFGVSEPSLSHSV